MTNRKFSKDLVDGPNQAASRSMLRGVGFTTEDVVKTVQNVDEDLFEHAEESAKKYPTVAGSLEEALSALSQDRDFLKQGDVFSDDLIDGYIALKSEEVTYLNQTTSPVEFDMYYSV